MKPSHPTATDLFVALTPDAVLEAVERSGLACESVCHPLNSFENRVYDVRLAEGGRVVAKFYRPGRWSAAQILEEHQFLADLAEAEIPVCGVRPFPGGETLQSIDGIFYCLHDRHPGRAPDELDDAQAERLGMLAARIHNVGAGRRALHRLRLDAATYLRPDAANLIERGVLPASLRARYAAAVENLADILDARLHGVAVHRIHGDLHAGNVLVADGQFRVLDFDDAVVGPAVQDLWLLFAGRDDHARRQRAAFLEGYEQFRDFDRSSLALIEPLRALRRVHYAAWLALRWHDPLFPATWPHFGTPAYWQEETADLEELLDLCEHDETSRGPTDTGLTAPGESPDDLTNRDFFWDWDGDESPPAGGKP